MYSHLLGIKRFRRWRLSPEEQLVDDRQTGFYQLTADAPAETAVLRNPVKFGV